MWLWNQKIFSNQVCKQSIEIIKFGGKKGTEFAEDLKADFDNTLGYVMEAGWNITKDLQLGCRLVFIDYSIDDLNINGDSFGIQGKLRF